MSFTAYEMTYVAFLERDVQATAPPEPTDLEGLLAYARWASPDSSTDATLRGLDVGLPPGWLNVQVRPTDPLMAIVVNSSTFTHPDGLRDFMESCRVHIETVPTAARWLIVAASPTEAASIEAVGGLKDHVRAALGFDLRADEPIYRAAHRGQPTWFVQPGAVSRIDRTAWWFCVREAPRADVDGGLDTWWLGAVTSFTSLASIVSIAATLPSLRGKIGHAARRIERLNDDVDVARDAHLDPLLQFARRFDLFPWIALREENGRRRTKGTVVDRLAELAANQKHHLDHVEIHGQRCTYYGEAIPFEPASNEMPFATWARRLTTSALAEAQFKSSRAANILETHDERLSRKLGVLALWLAILGIALALLGFADAIALWRGWSDTSGPKLDRIAELLAVDHPDSARGAPDMTMPNQPNDPMPSSDGPLDDYDAMLADHPSLAQNPDDATYQLLLDPADREAVRQHFVREFDHAGQPAAFADLGVVFDDRFITVLRDAVRIHAPGTPSDGAPRLYVRVLHRPLGHDGVAMLAVRNGEVLLLSHFRHATRSLSLQIPRGFAESGETWMDTARREFTEETGGEAWSVRSLGRLHPDDGIMAQQPYLALVEARGEGAIETAEARGYEWMPIAEVESRIADGRITDAFTIAALYRARLRGLLEAPPESSDGIPPEAPAP